MTTDDAPPQASRRYAMFISYRHADNLEMGRKWATWLHETVEAYEVPADLVGKNNLRGEPVPATLYPVFRDEEELPADADLSTNIERALENSGLLVVLCSPRAVQSRFVADEIRYFKELGKSGRILALIIDGEPNASDDPEKLARFGAAAECFPEPLRFGVPDEHGKVDWSRRTEPIAADCRPGGRPVQGWTTVAAYDEWLGRRQGMGRAERAQAVRDYADRLELAKLKVIAGALGLPLGELTQRDKARQLLRARRRARVLGGLSALFALFAGAAGVLGWLANEKRKDAETQRREADHQRNEADTQRLAAEVARASAENEKRQAVATLAASDFLEGVNRLAKPSTARAALAGLARSARAGNESAAIRIWTLFQQQAFWLPASSSTVPEAARTRLAPMEIPAAFRSVTVDGPQTAPTWYAESADGKRRVTVVSTAEAGEGLITFRFWDDAGKPLGPWHKLDYQGDYYLAGIAAAALSDDGRFAAIVAQPWRAPQYVELWDTEKGRRVGAPIPAGGGHPNDQGGAFTDVWFTEPFGPAAVPLLVTLSNRGDACMHRVDETGIWTGITHAHDQPVTHAVLDLRHKVFVSAAADQSIRVSGLLDAGPMGWPLAAPGAVEALQVDAPDQVTVRHDGGKATSWRLIRPAKGPASAQSQLAFTRDKALQKSWPQGDEEQPSAAAAPVIADQRGDRQLRVVAGNGLELIDAAKPGAPPSWSRRFPSAIAHARFSGDDVVIVQTAFFTTELWNVRSDAPVHPAIDEAALFTAGQRSDTVLLSSLSPDGKRVLTRSFFWDPPNVGVYAFTVWDAATGKPLADPVRVIDNVAADELADNHAEFSHDGNFLLLGRTGGGGTPTVSRSLQLVPPAAVRPLVPGLAEALGGLRLRADGNVEAADENPAAVIERVKTSIGAP